MLLNLYFVVKKLRSLFKFKEAIAFFYILIDEYEVLKRELDMQEYR
ncbi:hypothetical protein [Nostoc sp. C110]|nr:hypothetical protein [Desmonostoc muscorum FACHB-395]